MYIFIIEQFGVLFRCYGGSFGLISKLFRQCFRLLTTSYHPLLSLFFFRLHTNSLHMLFNKFFVSKVPPKNSWCCSFYNKLFFHNFIISTSSSLIFSLFRYNSGSTTYKYRFYHYKARFARIISGTIDLSFHWIKGIILSQEEMLRFYCKKGPTNASFHRA